MNTTRTVARIAFSVALLAGCSKQPVAGSAAQNVGSPTTPAASAALNSAPSAASAAAPPAGAASGSDVAISAVDLPHPRAGLWLRTSDAQMGQPATSTQDCVGDKPLVLMDTSNCQTYSYHRTAAGALVGVSQCMVAGVGGSMRVTAAGDFQSDYTTDMVGSLTETPGAAPVVVKDHAENRYLGPCPAGMAPD